MEKLKNTAEDALEALAISMKLLGKNNTAESVGGVCVWVTPSGAKFCAPISQNECSNIKRAVFFSGRKCP